MRIALLQPNIITYGGITSPPIALLFIGSFLQQHGHEVKIIDRNVDFFSTKKIIDFKPDVLGVTSITGLMLIDGLNMSKELKKLIPDIKVVWGGIHTSLLPEMVLRDNFIDYVVIGEGEVTFLELIKYLENPDGKIDDILGIGYRKNGKAVINPPRPPLKSMDDLPPINWELVNYKYYFKNEITLVTSRGCPFSCAFCYNQVYNKRFWRGWSAERTLQEINNSLKLTKAKKLRFYDDNFAANKKRLIQILDGLDKDLSLWFELRVDSIDEEILNCLKEFKKIWLFIGVESGNEDILKRMAKGITVQKIRMAFGLISKYKNIETTGSIVIGVPDETVDQIMQSIDLLEEINPTRYSICTYTPYPGAKFYEESVNKGLLIPPASTEGWANFLNTITLNKDIGHISDDVVQKVKKLYRWGYFKTVMNFVTHFELYKFKEKMQDYRSFLIGYLSFLK